VDELTFDVDEFRQRFAPAFDNQTLYPDATLQAYWDQAICMLSDCGCGPDEGACQRLLLDLMTAHLAYLFNALNTKKSSGIVTSAAIDKISVGMTPPPITSQWGWWLNQSPYGAQLLAMLNLEAAYSVYVPRTCRRPFGWL
jgi:hypothetical protein